MYLPDGDFGMTSPADEPTPPEGVPDRVATDLPELTPEELRNTIIYAQELLQFHDETASPIEPGPNEDIIRATEHDGYTEVVKLASCAQGCDDCPTVRISTTSNRNPGPRVERRHAGCSSARSIPTTESKGRPLNYGSSPYSPARMNTSIG